MADDDLAQRILELLNRADTTEAQKALAEVNAAMRFRGAFERGGVITGDGDGWARTDD